MQPSSQPSPQDSVILNKFDCLKNSSSQERLGPTDLARARNIDLDNEGQIHRRRGYSLVADGSYHSLYTSPSGVVFGVKNGSLGIINPDYSFVSLQTGVGSEVRTDGVAFATVADTLYFSNRKTSGKIDLNTYTYSPWGQTNGQGLWFSPVVNPTATALPVGGRLFGDPPRARALTYFNGRIYLAQRTTLWATELFLYDFVDKTKGYKQFESNIAALGSVTDGLYIGTETDLWFMSGDTFHTMRRIQLSNAGVIPGTLVTVPAEVVHPANMTQPIANKIAVVMMTQAGIVVGFDGGETYNLTQMRYMFPDAESGATLFRRQDGMDTLVTVLNSGGTPVQAAGFGDYLEATLVRGAGS